MTDTMPSASAPREHFDVLVIGAGIAGLTCASALHAAGLRVAVLDKSRGVGGRAATRRIEAQPVDHGIGFFHGTDPAFRHALRQLPREEVLEGWPTAVVGDGAPCQPDALDPSQWRLALRGGATTWAKSLARPLDVRGSHRVVGLEAGARGVVVHAHNDLTMSADDIVVALPVEQARALIATVCSPGRELRGVGALLAMIHSEPCLALAALWRHEDLPDIAWEMALPTDGIVQTLTRDSAKRVDPAFAAFVVHATPSWSRRNLESAPAAWASALLAAAQQHIGTSAVPVATHPHRWRFARIPRSDELVSPVLCPLPGGGRIGFAGEAFARGAGAEAAFLSGTRLASRLLESRATQRGAYA